MVNIKGKSKAKVLKALYDHSHIQGLGFLKAVPDGTVTVESSLFMSYKPKCLSMAFLALLFVP